MKLSVINLENKELKKIDLPSQFNEQIRQDLVKRDLLSIQSNNRQRYGADPRAGKRASAKLSRRRRAFKGSYGIGISRVPRKILSGKGSRWNWVGAVAPGTVGGRRAHAPKSEKMWGLKINKKEKEIALNSALAAVIDKEIVKKRGHLIPEKYPFVMSNDFEKIKNTKKLISSLEKLGFKEEIKRTERKKVRSGKGKMRGRKYKKKKSLLLVVSDKCDLLKSGKNITGIETVTVDNLNTLLLAPGADLGRATLFSEDAIERLRRR